MGKEVKKCTIVSGAPNSSVQFLEEKIDHNSFIIAADSGYKACERADIDVDVIIGDFDSSEYPKNINSVIKLPCEKDDTDTFYCVKYAVSKGFNDITIMCAIGDRFDHTYSNVLCLDYCNKHSANCRIIDYNNRISLINNKKTIYKDYEYFSLFAYLDDCHGVTINGAGYDVNDIDLLRHHQFAQSNYVKEEYVQIEVKKGTLLLVESND